MKQISRKSYITVSSSYFKLLNREFNTPPVLAFAEIPITQHEEEREKVKFHNVPDHIQDDFVKWMSVV